MHREPEYVIRCTWNDTWANIASRATPLPPPPHPSAKFNALHYRLKIYFFHDFCKEKLEIWKCFHKITGAISRTTHNTRLVYQRHSQPHSPEWARVSLSSFFLSYFNKFVLIFPQIFLIFVLILALWMGELPHPGKPWLYHCCLHSFEYVFQAELKSSNFKNKFGKSWNILTFVFTRHLSGKEKLFVIQQMDSFIDCLSTLPVGLSNKVEKNPNCSIAMATSVLMMNTAFNCRCLLPSLYASRYALYTLFQNSW